VAESYVGEIQAFPYYSQLGLGGFTSGSSTWVPCLGQVIPISANTALFSLIGTLYGGNGTSNFQLPNLNGMITNSQGQGPGIRLRDIGEVLGSNQVSLTSGEMAAHTHGLQLGKPAAQGAQPGPGQGQGMAAADPSFNGFVVPPSNTTLAPNAMTLTGNGQAHLNTQPTQAVFFCICTAGIYPSFGTS
jgi:microcystin-dependent protein